MPECSHCGADVDISSDRYVRLQETFVDPNQNREETYGHLLCISCGVDHMERDPTHSDQLVKRARREGVVDD